MANIAALVEKARKSGHVAVAPPQPIRLTPEVFGKLFVAAWAAVQGRSELPRREVVMAALVSNLESAPPEVLRVVHVDDHGVDVGVAEYSQYMAAAQMDGLIKRFNPDYVRVVVELDAATGERMLKNLSYGLDSTRDWVQTVVASLDGNSSPAIDGKTSNRQRAIA